MKNLKNGFFTEGKTAIFDKYFVFVFLFSVFILAYVFTPYWMLPTTDYKKSALLIFSICTGVLWSFWGSNQPEIHVKNCSYTALILLTVFIGIINLKTMTSAIPWKGDEDFHIFTVQLLIPIIRKRFPLLVLLLLFIYSGWRKSKWAVVIGCILLSSIILFNWFSDFYYPPILRYPYISRYFQVVLPLIFQPFGGDYYEFSYRIIPFVSSVAISWLVVNATALNTLSKLLIGLSVATIPVGYYYSSILYLEMPAAVLMLIVCLDIDKLLNDNFDIIGRNLSWYALIIIGFIKETAIIFIFVFIACRLINQIILFFRNNKRTDLNSILKNEIKIVYTVALPLIFYMYYRMAYSGYRSFSPDFSNLFTLEAYTAYARSFAEQFSLFTVLFIGGCIVYIYEKKYGYVSFLIFSILATMSFHIVDNIVYAGYSRFSLFLMPQILAGAVNCINYLIKLEKIRILFIVLPLLTVNLLLSPVNYDGTKKPFWGNYLCDTSEHYYPYPDVLNWLKKKHYSDIIIFSGMDYPYYLKFYFNKINWFPEYCKIDAKELAAFQKISEQASAEKKFVVVFHESGNNSSFLKEQDMFLFEKRFVNQAHAISVYTFDSNSVK